MSATGKAETERIANLLEKIEAHPLTARIREDEAAATLAKSKEAAAKIEALRREAENTLPGLQAEVTAREAELAKHDEARRAILSKVATARAALSRERLRLERERSDAEAVLLATYDPALDEAIEFFRGKREVLLRKKPDASTHAGERNLFKWTKKMTTISNVDAIESALRFCLVAIGNLEDMRLTPALDAARIEELKRNIPDTGEMTETIAEKSLPQ